MIEKWEFSYTMDESDHDPETTLTTVPPQAEVLANLDHLADQTRAYVAAGRAESTKRAYRHDWDRFASWCGSQGLQALPAEPATVAFYAIHLVSNGRKVAGIERALAAISKAHRVAGHESPRKTEAVREVMRGIRRTHGVAQTQKAAISVAELRKMCKALPENLIGTRDRALLLVGFAGAFRRSELVAINVNDLHFTAEGLEIQIRRSKTDQEAEGRKVGIPFGSDIATCPVRSLQRWLEAADIEQGAVFRSVNKGGRLASRESDEGRLAPHDVGRIIKRAAMRANLDASEISGHSLRAGLVTAAAKSGKPEHVIMRQTGHQSAAMLRRYIRSSELFSDNAAAGIGL